MRLERLTIRQLPGLRPGFTLEDPAPGINLVTGPNASGKSSLVRALRYLIDDACPPAAGAVDLEAVLTDGACRWRATRIGSQVQWERDGKPVEPPAFPSGEFLRCYWLAMADLVDEGATEQAIVERLNRELRGGFDLRALAKDPRFTVGPRHGQGLERDLQGALAALREVERRYDVLERERRALPALQAQIEEAERCTLEARRVEEALALLSARRERLQAQSRLDTFEPDMERLSPDAGRRLEQLESSREQLLSERRQCRQRAEEARARIEALDVSADTAKDPALSACREALEALEAVDARIADLERQLDGCHAEQRRVAAALGGVGHLPAVTAHEVDEAVSLAQQLLDVKAELNRIGVPAAEAPPAEAERMHADMAAVLRQWLTVPNAGACVRLTAVGGVSLVGGVAAAMLSWAAGAGLAAAVAMLAGLAGGGALWVAQVARAERRRLQRRAETLAADGPPAWTVAAVSQRLAALEAELEGLRWQAHRARAWAEVAPRAEQLRRTYEELEGRRQDLAQRYGFEPTTAAAGIARFLQLARVADEAGVRQDALERALARERETHAERLAEIADTLARFGAVLPPGGEADRRELRVALNALQEKIEAAQSAQRDLEEAERLLARLDRDLADTDEGIARHYRDNGLEPGDRAGLSARLQRLADYQKEKQALQAAEIREAERRSALDGEATLLAMVEGDDEAGLSARLSRLKAQASRSEELRSRRADIHARLEQAGGDKAMEAAQARYDHVHQALAGAYEEAMVAEAGQFLLADVAEAHRAEHEPAVLAEARRRFARYTHHRYDLALDEAGEIVAYDREQERHCALDMLSTGTRMQLLMAVRMAWTAELEAGGSGLPIFLDEALSSTDPARFAQIVRSLDSLAQEEGRQIFYLSTDPADVVRWQRALGRRPHHIDLPALRFGRIAPAPEQYGVPEVTGLPPPAGKPAAQYAAEIGIPALHPGDGAASVPIFYLLRDDLVRLHRLMDTWKVHRLGPLEALLDSEAAATAVPEHGLRRRLQSRCAGARAWVAAWARGRGRPVDRNVLERSGAVSDKFLEPVAALAQTLNGDAQALIEALRRGDVARFRRDKADRLAEWLEANGYIDSEPRLSAEGRQQAALRQAGAQGADPAEVGWVIASLEAAWTQSASAPVGMAVSR